MVERATRNGEVSRSIRLAGTFYDGFIDYYTRAQVLPLFVRRLVLKFWDAEYQFLSTQDPIHEHNSCLNLSSHRPE